MAAQTSPLARFARSTIGLKIAMALTGAGLAGFVLFHMFGNLQVYSGREAFNAYAEFMYGLGGLLWLARLGLLAMLVVHVWAAMQLTQRNRAARPVPYASLRQQVTTPYAKMMMLTGLVVLAYLAYHLAHFTLGVVHTEYFDAVETVASGTRRDVYTNFVHSFQNPVIAILYVVANLLLAAHLAHAISSMFRTLGLSSGRFRGVLDRVGPAFGIVVALGNLSMPLAVLLGVID